MQTPLQTSEARTEKKLAAAEEIFGLLVDSVTDYAIFALDIDGNVMTWNTGAARLKGFEAAEIIGKHISTFYTNTDVNRRHPQLELEIAAAVGRYEEEGWRVRKDGTQFWANVVISKLVDQQKRHIGFAKVTRDLSERKAQGEKLKASEERLIASHAALETAVAERTRELLEAKLVAENASITKSTFLANMSHEIRTPLGAIMGFADLMGKSDVPREEVNTYLSVIQRNSAQVLRIIDDILDLSKVEAGRMDIESIRFSLPEVLADTASMLGLRARENSIRFILKADTPIPNFVNSDPTRLRQIIMNIVGNAIKFTDKGSVQLSIALKDDVLTLAVRDTGRGISIEQAGKLFQPFTQADASTTRKYGGTGLGLALTKGLCQSMGGDFVLTESALGEGSTFTAHIRVEVAKDAEYINDLNTKISFEIRNEESKVLPLEGMKILLVEDSPDNQHLIRVLLSRAGATTDIANDGLEGVKMAMAKEYDAVLMDIQMPHMDGLEAVRQLRSKNYQKPVIALTAHAMKEHRSQALSAGFTNYLSKPIQLEPMIEALRSVRGR